LFGDSGDQNEVFTGGFTMSAQQIILPFRTSRSEVQRNSNADLVGRSYQEDEYTTVTVIGLIPGDKTRVLFRRDPGGGTYSMLGWLMRFALMEFEFNQKRSRRAA
jgi:hypothetical protein